MKLALHWLALLIETLGTLLVWLDTVRLNARNPAEGITLGDPPGYAHWWYHCSFAGFSLLLLGILVAGVSLLLEHYRVADDSKPQA